MYIYVYIYIYIYIYSTECVEIKCQLDATEVFIADLIACSTCFGHHYAHHQELKSIVQWLLPVVFRAVDFKLLVWCGAEGIDVQVRLRTAQPTLKISTGFIPSQLMTNTSGCCYSL